MRVLFYHGFKGFFHVSCQFPFMLRKYLLLKEANKTKQNKTLKAELWTTGVSSLCCTATEKKRALHVKVWIVNNFLLSTSLPNNKIKRSSSVHTLYVTVVQKQTQLSADMNIEFRIKPE